MNIIFFLLLLISTNIYAAPQRAVLIDGNEQALGTSANPVNVSISGGGIFSVKTYNAKGDGKQFEDGAITTGTPNFTSATATFTSADVGKVITIVNAGGTNINLTTTIAAYVSATAVTLTDNASATVSSTHFAYGTDDAAAIQAAIDAAGTAKGGTIFFPDGIYIVNGSFQNAGTDNSVIHLPSNNKTNEPFSIVLKGIYPGWMNYGTGQKKGSIIYFTKIGTAGQNYLGIYGGATTVCSLNFSSVYVKMEDLIIRTVQNPLNNVVNLYLAGQAEVNHLLIEPGYAPGDSYVNGVLPTGSSSYGLIMPGTCNHAIARVKDSIVFNYYNGIQAWEHGTIQDTGVYGCVTGIELPKTGHPVFLNNVSLELNKYHITSSSSQGGSNGQQNRVEGSIHFEFSTTPAAFATTYVVNDSGNLLTGTLKATALNSQAYTSNGRANLDFQAGGNNSTQPYTFGLSGNTGIGTNQPPDSKFLVRGTAATYIIQANDGTRKGGIYLGSSVVGGQGGVGFISRTNDNAFFGANGAAGYIMVAPSGNVGIGTYILTSGKVQLPPNGTAVGQASCWGTNNCAGYCTSVVGAGGACTCTCL